MAQDPDIISLEGMVFFGRHGARKEERSLGQQFEVDVHVEADLSQARTTDDLGAVVLNQIYSGLNFYSRNQVHILKCLTDGVPDCIWLVTLILGPIGLF